MLQLRGDAGFRRGCQAGLPGDQLLDRSFLTGHRGGRAVDRDAGGLHAADQAGGLPGQQVMSNCGFARRHRSHFFVDRDLPQAFAQQLIFGDHRVDCCARGLDDGIPVRTGGTGRGQIGGGGAGRIPDRTNGRACTCGRPPGPGRLLPEPRHLRPHGRDLGLRLGGVGLEEHAEAEVSHGSVPRSRRPRSGGLHPRRPV